MLAPRLLLTCVGLAFTASAATAQILLFEDFGEGNERLGYSVANAGDVNGDGTDDLVTGAIERGSSGTGFGPGFIRVYSGVDGTVLLEVEGASVGDTFGFSVDGAGDVDGDGLADIVVGAPQLGTQPAAGGYVRVISGVTGATLRQFTSSQPGARAGHVVRGMEDLDGDGVPDILMTAPEHSFLGLMHRGQVSVMSVGTGGTLATYGGGHWHRLGLRAFVGDFDDDSVMDFAALANPPQAWPHVRVWSGASFAHIVDLPIRAKDNVGDWNGDGIDDLAWSQEVYSGADGALLVEFANSGVTLPTLLGDTPGGSGDYDGDGTLDLLLGTSQIYGTSGVFSGDSELLSHHVGYPASSVCDLGDLDGDGFSDYALGFMTIYGSSPALPSGVVRIYRGAPPAPISSHCSAGNGLRFSGTSSFTNNDLELEAFSLPVGQLGVVILGDQEQDVPFGAGQLCVGGNILRVGLPVPIVLSTMALPMDLSQPPFSSVQPGDTRSFQFWYRTQTGFDLTRALSVTFGL